MAFSTQKDLLHVTFLNERPEPTCVRMEGIKLKTYASTPDERAWSTNKDQQAQYLIDLVACRMYSGGEAGDGFQENLPPCPSKSSNAFGDQRSPRNPCAQSDPCGSRASRNKRNTCGDARDNLTPTIGDDSVIHAAVEGMTRLERLLAEKEDLRSQLEVSQEKLKILKEEKQTINAILNDEHYPEMSCKLERKIAHLKCSSKIDKNDENELLKILHELHNREKAYKVLDAQNSYLRRLIEKQSNNGRQASIPVDPERSTDVNYLQCEVDNLRKEVSRLRYLEDKQLEKAIQGSSKDKDAENVAKIIAERNALRQKIEGFAAFEEKISQWKREAEEFKCFRSEACCVVKKKDEEIQDLQEEIEELQYELCKIGKCCKKKDQEGQSLCTSIDCLREENRIMREEICMCNCEMKKIQCELQFLTKELCEKKCIIYQYEMQLEQLLGVIEDLQKKDTVDIRSLQDVDSQTHNDQIDELATTTRATLDQISKELEARQGLEADLAKCKAELKAKELENRQQKDNIMSTSNALRQSYELLDHKALPGDNCADQVEQLKGLIADLKNERDSLKEELKKATSAKGEADEFNKSLTAAQNEKQQLQNQNDELIKALKDCQTKVKSQEDQLAKLTAKTDALESEMKSSKAEVKEVGKLVKDISNVQDRNENLQSVLGAVDYSDKLQKEIEDLKRKLGEEYKKNTNCMEQNKLLETKLNQAKKEAAEAVAAATAAKAAVEDMKKSHAEAEKAFARESAAKEAELKAAAKAAAAKAAAKAAADAKAAAEKAAAEKAAAEKAAAQKAAAAAAAAAAEAARAAAPEAARAPAEDGAAASGTDGKQVKRSSKVAQLQKNYEREIDGHRLSNEVLRKSITKLANQIQGKAAMELEREFRLVLENFVQEICKWRCEKPCMKLTKLQEICKKIVEMGIDCLTYKELVYLHQQLSETASKLKPKGVSPHNARRELTCCKCSGDICCVPTISKENEKILLEKLGILERDIQSARENLRKIKQEQDTDSPDTDSMELDTLRANTFRLSHGTRNSSVRPGSSHFRYAIKEEFEVPTKDRCGF